MPDTTAGLMLGTESDLERSKLIRFDAYMALGTSALAILVLGLHASGRSRAAYGIAMTGTAVTGAVGFARLLTAANRLERVYYMGGP